MAQLYPGLAFVPGIDYRHDESIPPADQTRYSPGSIRTAGVQPGESGLDGAARLVRARLASPGTVSDYMVAIAAYLDALWAVRREVPGALEELEHTFWLGLTLIEQHADELSRWEHDGRPRSLIWPFRQMRTVYEREGYLREALAVGEREERLGTWFAATPLRTGEASETEGIRVRIALIEGEPDAR